MKETKVISNTAMLYIMSIAKLIFPLITLPYLTRVLSDETYGFVSYVKNCMTYVQLIIDFGFILSSVKDIVNAGADKDAIARITGNTFAAKLVLAGVSAVVVALMCLTIPLLQLNIAYVALSFVAVALTAFLADFLFQGIEKMHYITIIFLIAKSVAVVLTFVLVKGDDTLMWIPVIDIAMHLISVAITVFVLVRLGLRIRVGKIPEWLVMIKKSFTYFLSTIATTAFTALNTLAVGIFIQDLRLVAHWSLCLNIISAIQNLYAPICNGVYPHMIRRKSLAFLHKVLLIVMPVVSFGCVFSYLVADNVMLLVGGEQYIGAGKLLQYMIPILFFCFPVQLYGWPALGAIGKAKAATATTVITAVLQVAGVVILAVSGHFSVYTLAMLRGATEFIFMALRMYLTYKNRHLFN